MHPQTTKRLGLLKCLPATTLARGWLDVASGRSKRSCFRRPWIMEQTVLIPGAGRPTHDHTSLHFKYPTHFRHGPDETTPKRPLYSIVPIYMALHAGWIKSPDTPEVQYQCESTGSARNIASLCIGRKGSSELSTQPGPAQWRSQGCA